jgi:hypothetical protein
MSNHTSKFSKKGLTPETLYQIFLECSVPGTPVKTILEQHGLKPWDLSIIRKRVRESALAELSRNGRSGAPKKMIPLEEYRKVEKELVAVKDALATIGHELALLKKNLL